MNKLVIGLMFIVALGIGYIIPKADSAHLQDEMMWSQASQFGVMLKFIRVSHEEKDSVDPDFNSFLQKQANLYLNYSKNTENDALADYLIKQVETIDEYLSIMDD